MDTLRKNARVAGLLYLIVVLTGPFVLLYVPGKLIVPGNATATAGNILAHETLYRANIIVGLVGELAFLLSVLALYRLLKDVHRELAALMVILILVVVPLALLSTANEIATLALVRGAEILSAFEKPQRDALATLLIKIDSEGTLVSEMFWGLWLLPLGTLVYRSRFLPRFLGVWLFINGLAYVAISLVGMVAPAFQPAVSRAATPVLFGEAAFMLWLLIMGGRDRTLRGKQG